jgi:hypothetical protein
MQFDAIRYSSFFVWYKAVTGQIQQVDQDSIFLKGH